jgi:hypothetical protein
VFTQAFGFFQHRNIESGHVSTRFPVAAGQPSQLDGAGEACRTRADDEHVHLERFGAWFLTQNQPIERKGRLMAERENGRHGMCSWLG